MSFSTYSQGQIHYCYTYRRVSAGAAYANIIYCTIYRVGCDDPGAPSLALQAIHLGAPYGIHRTNDKTYAAQSKTSYMYHINEKMENETSAFILHYPFSILHYSTSTPLIRADSSPVSGMTRHFCPSTTSVWTFTALSCDMRTSMTVPVSHGTSSSSASAAFAA